MNRRALLLPVLAFIAACQGTEPTLPNSFTPPPPDLTISDGAHSGGNPDFWFLPPMVPNPAGNPEYLNNAFQADLHPEVEITAGATVILPKTPATANGDHYHLNWKVPNSPTTEYRVTIWVGKTAIGFADLWTSASNAELKNVNTAQYVPLKDGRTLPIKFVIEEYAFCAVAGEGPCASEVVNFATGGKVTLEIEGAPGLSGVEIPPQGAGPTPVITVEPCADGDLNPRVTDLPVFGPCLTVKSDTDLGENALASAATVFVCDFSTEVSGLTPAQAGRITLHKYDPGVLTALPHAPHVCEESHASAGFRGFLGNLARREFRSAGKQLAAMVSPKPLYARAMMLDVGAGGFTEDFSDFQFALPSKMTKIAATDEQTALPGSTLPANPTVLVTDLGGVPVAGARVNFAALDGSATPSSSVTGPDGIAYASWTLKGTAGANFLTASGRGIASEGTNGPRCDFDPFQAIQGPPHPAEFGPTSPCAVGANGPADEPEPVLSGSVSFSATGIALLGSSSSGGGNDLTVEPNPGSLFSIDAATGLATRLGSIGILSRAGKEEVSAIKFDPTDGKLYGVVGSATGGATLVTIDPNTGAGTLVGNLIGAGFNAAVSGGSDALAFASDGSLYAGGWSGGLGAGSLLKIDKTSGAVIAGFATTGGIHLAGLTFDAAGVLWASRGNNTGGAGTGFLYRIDPTNGQTLSTLTLSEALVISDLASGGGNVLYASLPKENKLASINTVTGLVTRIGSFGAAVAKMSGLAYR